MIGPLLRVAASAAAARSLRNAAHDVATRAMLAMGAALAIGGVPIGVPMPPMLAA